MVEEQYQEGEAVPLVTPSLKSAQITRLEVVQVLVSRRPLIGQVPVWLAKAHHLAAEPRRCEQNRTGCELATAPTDRGRSDINRVPGPELPSNLNLGQAVYRYQIYSRSSGSPPRGGDLVPEAVPWVKRSGSPEWPL